MNTRRSFLGCAAAATTTALLSMSAVERIAAAATSTATPRGVRRAARRPYPDVILRDQENRPLRLYEDLIQNRVVVINVAYTGCAGVCPLAVQNLKRVHEAMRGEVGNRFSMLTVTLDPIRDTPGRLRQTMQRDRVPSRGWSFLTGTTQAVDLTRRRLGFFDLDPFTDADLGQHTGLLAIGNDRFDWWCMTPSLASPALITAAIRRMLSY